MSPDDVTTAAAEPETATHVSTRRLLSGDGTWWWNGRRWVPATTEDGLWKWDGSRWKVTVDLEGKRPEDLATTLALLAEDRYAEAGVILANRAAEWQPDGGLRDLVGRALEAADRLGRVSEGLHVADGSRGLRRRLGATADERRQLEDERESLGSEQRALMVRLGRSAPQPRLMFLPSGSTPSATTSAPDHFAALTVASRAAASSAPRSSSSSQSPTVTASTAIPC